MARSTIAQIIEVWDQVASLDRKGKAIIRDRLNAELSEPKSTIREPEITITRLPSEEGQ